MCVLLAISKMFFPPQVILPWGWWNEVDVGAKLHSLYPQASCFLLRLAVPETSRVLMSVSEVRSLATCKAVYN